MSLWQVQSGSPEKVKETKLALEGKLEQDLEDWIAADPQMLGEPLFVIGRQVLVTGVKDKLDLLALDPNGKAVIVELKRGTLKDPVDMQSLRYASYISRWKFKDFETTAKGYLGGDPDFNFLDAYEQFCSDHLDEDEETPTPNQDQRIIIVGGQVRDKLGSVALWLREHKIDIKVIEIKVFRQGESLLVEPITIVPTPVGKFDEVGGGSGETATKPWKEDGMAWHLEKRCNPTARTMLEQLLSVLETIPELEGPSWAQKHYVSFQYQGTSCLKVITYPKMLQVNLSVVKGTITAEAAAQRLSVEVFQSDGTISDKFALASSVDVNDKKAKDLIKIRCKEEFKFGDTFVGFVRECLALGAPEE
jgi:hypothetical protein